MVWHVEMGLASIPRPTAWPGQSANCMDFSHVKWVWPSLPYHCPGCWVAWESEFAQPLSKLSNGMQSPCSVCTLLSWLKGQPCELLQVGLWWDFWHVAAHFRLCGACGLWSYVGFLWAAARLGSAGHFGLQTECILRRTWQLFSAIFWEGIKPYCINFSPVHLGSY